MSRLDVALALRHREGWTVARCARSIGVDPTEAEERIAAGERELAQPSPPASRPRRAPRYRGHHGPDRALGGDEP